MPIPSILCKPDPGGERRCSAVEEDCLTEEQDNDSERAHSDFHGGPGAESFGNGHAQVFFDEPEAGVVHVGDGGAAAADGEDQHFRSVAVELFHERGKHMDYTFESGYLGCGDAPAGGAGWSWS